MKNIVFFASGGGSSVENMLRFFIKESQINVLAIFCNNQKAGLLKRNFLKNYKIITFKNNDLLNGNVLEELKMIKPELIVLAGFLKKNTNRYSLKF